MKQHLIAMAIAGLILSGCGTVFDEESDRYYRHAISVGERDCSDLRLTWYDCQRLGG